MDACTLNVFLVLNCISFRKIISTKWVKKTLIYHIIPLLLFMPLSLRTSSMLSRSILSIHLATLNLEKHLKLVKKTRLINMRKWYSFLTMLHHSDTITKLGLLLCFVGCVSHLSPTFNTIVGNLSFVAIYKSVVDYREVLITKLACKRFRFLFHTLKVQTQLKKRK